MATEQQQTNPMFGRPTWTYVNVIRGPVAGPQPRLAQGTGRTGKPASPGTGAQLPGYVSDNTYQPSPFTYQPVRNDNFEKEIPRTIGIGQDGRDIVGTYQPHDFTPAQRFFHQLRSANPWQIQAFGPNFRNTIAWQQVQKYRVKSSTISAQPLASNNYFLGYQVQPEIQAQIGQSSLGYMGSV
jgi:hypothetical protein